MNFLFSHFIAFTLTTLFLMASFSITFGQGGRKKGKCYVTVCTDSGKGCVKKEVACPEGNAGRYLPLTDKWEKASAKKKSTPYNGASSYASPFSGGRKKSKCYYTDSNGKSWEIKCSGLSNPNGPGKIEKIKKVEKVP